MTKLDDLLLKLQGLQGYSSEEYQADELVQGSCERYMQVAIECCTDIASHLLAAYGLGRPTQRRDVFRVLAEAGYLEPDYAEKMVQMVQLRNRLVHLYWDIDPARMYHYLQNDLPLLQRFRGFTVAIAEKARQEQEEGELQGEGQ
ncbi:MAG: DUF86 domain-containing protein [Chloroflexi bacterium]|nr:DUF86 domain-containing protein [Chloroflexota bacterium]